MQENNALIDRYGRRFRYLRLSITDVCNFKCSYCLPDGYQCDSERDFLRPTEIATLVSAFAGLGTRKVRITGGEPSLRKDLSEIIELCAQTPGIEQVAMTTNGFKLKQQVARWQQAGLTKLNLSIDSLDPRQFNAITGHNSLQDILAGLEDALALGLEVKVNAVLLKPYSEGQMHSFMAWLKSMPVTLRFIELMQTGDNQLYFKHNHLSGQPIKQQLLEQGWVQLLRDNTAGPAQEFSHPDYAGRIGLIMPYSKDFCSSCNRLRVSALGKLHLCLFAEQGLDLRALIQQGDVAALQQQLMDLLGHKEASHWLDQGYTGATRHLAMLGG